MLVLGRKVGETIHLTGGIVIKVESCRKGHVRLAFDAPPDVIIKRGEHVQGTDDDRPPSYYPAPKGK